MKDWEKYQFTVNGFKMEVSYHKRTVQEIFLPLLRRMTHLQKERGERLLVFMAAPPAAGKTTLCQFLEYLSREIPELTEIQAAGLDGFHYHSDYINSHDAVVQGKTVPMKAVKGCPETYDTAKLGEKLCRIKKETILWPVYDRNIHDVVEDAIKLEKEIILLEGNWLLLDEEPWAVFRKKWADDTIFILAEEKMLKERLIQRKEKGGLSREEAEKWYENSDSSNVRRVLKSSVKGNLILEMEEDNDYRLMEDSSACNQEWNRV